MCHELQIFAFVYMYLDANCLFILRDSDFGITPLGDNAIGITYTAFCFHIPHISFANSIIIIIIIIIINFVTIVYAKCKKVTSLSKLNFKHPSIFLDVSASGHNGHTERQPRHSKREALIRKPNRIR